MKINKNFCFNFLFIIVLTIIFVFTFSINVFAATPKIVTKLSNAFENIESWIIKLSTPAAAVSVGVGLFMKKFSFGDEERIRSSKKIIRGTLVAYGLLLATDLILSAIKSLVG